MIGAIDTPPRPCGAVAAMTGPGVAGNSSWWSASVT